MINDKIIIDLNAHINNITATVELENGTAVTYISFNNTDHGVITAVKLLAKGYNSFGDIIKFDGQDTFTIILQDLNVLKNKNSGKVKSNLPDASIRKIDLRELQVCYSDGEVVNYAGENKKEFNIKKYDNSTDDVKLVKAIKHNFGVRFIYEPTEYDDGWICGCGHYNSSGKSNCSLCGISHENAFLLTTEQGRKDIETKEKKHRHKSLIAIIITAIIVVLVVMLIIYASIISGRSTYQNAKQMRQNVYGNYIEVDDDGEIMRGTKTTVVINKQGLEETMVIPSLSASESDSVFTTKYKINKWSYKAGTFEIEINGLKYTVTVYNDGSIGYLHQRFIRNYDKNGSSSSSVGATQNDIQNDLVLENKSLKASADSDYAYYYGTVRNKGSVTHSFIKVTVTLYDEYGNVVNTDYGYAVGDEGLAPGEAKQFDIMVANNYHNIAHGKMRITDFQ